jgi:hypothetical protein
LEAEEDEIEEIESKSIEGLEEDDSFDIEEEVEDKPIAQCFLAWGSMFVVVCVVENFQYVFIDLPLLAL